MSLTDNFFLLFIGIDPKFSNLFIRKVNNKYLLYSKNTELKKTLKNANYKIFSFLVKNKIIFPFYKTYFPGTGSDYHYFGSINTFEKINLFLNRLIINLNGIKNLLISVIDSVINLFPGLKSIVNIAFLIFPIICIIEGVN